MHNFKPCVIIKFFYPPQPSATPILVKSSETGNLGPMWQVAEGSSLNDTNKSSFKVIEGRKRYHLKEYDETNKLQGMVN